MTGKLNMGQYMMKKIYSGLLCFFTIWSVFARAQATTTTPLEPYLVASVATPPIAVNFSYSVPPPYAATDYPSLRQATGKLYTKAVYSWLSLIAYDDAYIASDGAVNIGLVSTRYEMFSSLREGHPRIPEISCDVPLIPMQGVSGSAFPITRSVDTTHVCGGFTLPPARPAVPSYLVAYNAPSIVTVADGNQIESVKISVLRDGTPWADYFFGYRIGLIQMAAAPATASIFRVPVLNTLTLPPPPIEGSVVEYNNFIDFPSAPGGHFFYSSDAGERQFVDSGQAGYFYRTGRSFNAGGYVPVCRFYGGQTPGPNSHFFSADQNECAGLKALQKSPVPTDVQQWNSEGNGFYAVSAVTDANGNRSCLTGTVPVYRAYNNAYTKDGKRNAWDSNHRFSTDRADFDLLVNTWGWSDEGIAFCAPS